MAPRKKDESTEAEGTVELNGSSDPVVADADSVSEVPAPADAPETTEPAPADEDATSDEAEQDPEDVKRFAIIGAVGGNGPQDDVVDPIPTDTPTKAGSVEVKVVADGFAWLDKDGFHQSATKGETVKVSAAQADRGEELGAVERV